jgi:hypothetical protein
MPQGELVVLRAFFELELDDRNELLDKKRVFPTITVM